MNVQTQEKFNNIMLIIIIVCSAIILCIVIFMLPGVIISKSDAIDSCNQKHGHLVSDPIDGYVCIKQDNIL